MLQIMVGIAAYNAGLTADQAVEVWDILREASIFSGVYDAHVQFENAIEQVKASTAEDAVPGED